VFYLHRLDEHNGIASSELLSDLCEYFQHRTGHWSGETTTRLLGFPVDRKRLHEVQGIAIALKEYGRVRCANNDSCMSADTIEADDDLGA